MKMEDGRAQTFKSEHPFAMAYKILKLGELEEYLASPGTPNELEQLWRECRTLGVNEREFSFKVFEGVQIATRFHDTYESRIRMLKNRTTCFGDEPFLATLKELDFIRGGHCQTERAFGIVALHPTLPAIQGFFYWLAGTSANSG
ncbi:hypothetical protein EON80_10730 [bacterium]|nr:MAG: hypothetical protein EON80_10730 [bacterium]